MPDLRAKALSVALAEHRGYLEQTRRNGPSYTGKAGRLAHELHEAKMALLVELLEAETERQGVRIDDGYCCESLRRYGTCACPDREQVVGR